MAAKASYVLLSGITLVLLATPYITSGLETPNNMHKFEFFERPSETRLLLNKTVRTISIHATFNWSLPPRYGLDANRNAIIDLPNSFEYAHNLPLWRAEGCECFNNDCETGRPQFRVRFDAKGTFPPLSSSPGSFIRPLLERAPVERAPARVEERAELQPAARYTVELGQRLAMRRLGWKIEGGPLPQPFTVEGEYSATQVIEQCLPEGDYTITLKATDDYTNEWDEYSRVITVEDFVIVQLGDSYGSGEGNPERRIVATVSAPRPYNEIAASRVQTGTPGYVYALWADDGQPFNWIDVEASASFPLGRDSIPVTLRAHVPNFNEFSSMHREHYRSNRSSFTASSQLALQLEEQSDKWSVTYINLAMSGATTNEGVLGSYKGQKGARFTDEPSLMDSQLDQLARIVRNRSIDAVILSIGGNDAGFAHAAAALVAHDGFYCAIGACVKKDLINHGVHTGNWASVENATGFFGWFLKWSDLVGLDGLADQYAAIRDRMGLLRLNIQRVYVTQYPNFGRKYYPEQTINYLGTSLFTIPARVDYCEQILNSIQPNSAPGGLEVTSGELSWATSNVLVPLNQVIQQATVNNGWTFVDKIVESMESHGLCAWAPYEAGNYAPSHPVIDRADEPTMRWFRRETEASIMVGTAKDKATGTLHPNEYGHKAIKKRLLEVITLPPVQDYSPCEDFILTTGQAVRACY